MFDLNLIPLNYVDGKEQPEMPELYGALAPRGAARGRAQEQLVLNLVMLGSSPLSAIGLRQLLVRLSQVYFKTPGSVTAAQRVVADSVNNYLLERNLHSASTGRQAIGSLNLAVVRNQTLYLAQSGSAQAFLISPQLVQQFSDPQMASRGLGLTSNTAIRYYQGELTEASYLVLSANAPAVWSKTTLAGSSSGGLEALRRRLLDQSLPNLSAVLVQVKTGKGRVIQPSAPSSPAATSQPLHAPEPYRPEPVQPSSTPPVNLEPQQAPVAPPITAEPPASLPVTSIPTQVGQTAAPTSPASIERTPPSDVQATSPAEPPTHSTPVRQPEITRSTSAETAMAAAPTVPQAAKRTTRPTRSGSAFFFNRKPKVAAGKEATAPAPTQATALPQENKPRRSSTFLRGVSAFLSSARALNQRISQGLQTAVTRLLPGNNTALPGLSNTAMIFIAVAVPVVVVAVAMVVYFDKGRSEYYRVYFTQAQLSANQAVQMKDVESARTIWKGTLAQLDKAENYQKTTESQALRQQAWNTLDKLDGLERLDFKQITSTELGKGVNITRIVAFGSELYLLDASKGRILYFVQTSHGYEVDTTFSCGPGGQSGDGRVGPLVDMVAMPVNNKFKASLAAVDAAGNLMYCMPGGTPIAFPLVAPDINWGQVTAMKLDSNILYVLDPKTNSIYYYELNVDNDYRDPPKKLFENPPDITNGIDIAINSNEIYILHDDGTLTDCTVNNPLIAPTRCTYPAVFVEFRKDRAPNPTTFAGTRFTQILYTPPPGPSLYILDANAATIYHFSVTLNLQRLLGAGSQLVLSQSSPTATAFTINKNRTAFLAWGNRVYYAYVP
jgi:hypothetical protein